MKNKHLIVIAFFFTLITLLYAIFSTMKCRIDETLGNAKKPAIYLYPKGESIERKPAIYAYTNKPLKINLILDKSIKITYDAPKHHPNKGWNVLAYPDGRIKDIQPEYTDCNKLESNKFGLEYAKKACETNNYPYVFWEGYSTTKSHPERKDGWIVDKGNLKVFLSKKLDYIGFNKAEKDEFLEYWVTILTKEKEEKFFINFLQTQEVNAYAPLTVNPKPESVNRIYMVVKPLKHDLDLMPQSQKLEKFKRKGFTLVEWGGTVDK